MEILNLIQCTNLGGTEMASLRLMRGLQARGHQLRLLSLNPIGRLAPLLEEAGIPFEGLDYRGKGGWRSFPQLKKKLAGIRAEALIMTGHNLLGNLALGRLCRGRRVLAIHFHHAGVKPSWQWRMIYGLACRSFDAIVFPSDFIRQEAEAIHPNVAKLAHTVRNPMPLPPLPTAGERAQARAALGLEPNRPVVGNAGWLIPRKRFDVFLRVARLVLKQRPETLFAIAGDGDERPRLTALAAELGISANVRWLGWQKEMSNFYKALDVLHFNSDWDAFPNTPQEAMSFGVPVVCSCLNGGLGEILSSDSFGLLRGSHDERILADLLVRLLNEPAEAGALGLAGRGRIGVLADSDSIAEWHERALGGAPVAVQAPPLSAAVEKSGSN